MAKGLMASNCAGAGPIFALPRHFGLFVLPANITSFSCTDRFTRLLLEVAQI